MNIYKSSFYLGCILLLMAIINGYYSPDVTPSFQRAEVVACASSIILLAFSLITVKPNIETKGKVSFSGNEGFFLFDSINQETKEEIAWATKLILTTTSTSTLIIIYNGINLAKRGIISDNEFVPGEICKQANQKNQLTYLANTKLFPGRFEFDTILLNLPSIIVSPLANRGYLILGGTMINSYNNRDKILIQSITEKLITVFANDKQLI